jgi:replicative DNA helicase
MVMLLYREEVYKPEGPTRGVVELIIAKHRHGPETTIQLLFMPMIHRFVSLSTLKEQPGES